MVRLLQVLPVARLLMTNTTKTTMLVLVLLIPGRTAQKQWLGRGWPARQPHRTMPPQKRTLGVPARAAWMPLLAAPTGTPGQRQAPSPCPQAAAIAVA
jgi:hypothetical protein